MSKNILGSKKQFFGSNFGIVKNFIGKEINPCQTRITEDFSVSLVKSLPMKLKTGSGAAKNLHWYNYQWNLKSFYQWNPKNPQNHCQYCVCRFTNETAQKVSLVNSQTLSYQGLNGKNKKTDLTVYINIYRNPP